VLYNLSLYTIVEMSEKNVSTLVNDRIVEDIFTDIRETVSLDGQEKFDKQNVIYEKIENGILGESGFSTIDINTPMKSINDYLPTNSDTNSIYSPKFREMIDKIQSIIARCEIEKQTSNIKYTLIGKLLYKFNCNNNKYADRFRNHVVNMYAIHVWNKKILMLKLDEMLQTILKNIGGCDQDIISSYTIKNNLAAKVARLGQSVHNNKSNRKTQKTKTIRGLEIDVTTGEYVDENDIDNDVSSHKSSSNNSTRRARTVRGLEIDVTTGEYVDEKYIKNDVKIESEMVNYCRTQFILFKELYDNKMVSPLEFAKEKENNQAYWLVNPARITFANALTNSVLSIANIQNLAKDFLNSTVSNREIINSTVAGLFPLVGPIISFGVMTVITSAVNSSWYQKLEHNKKVNNEFQESLKNWKENKNKDKSGFIAEYACSYLKNTKDYVKKFKNARDAITEYNKLIKEYDSFLLVLNDLNNIYTIFCNEPIKYKNISISDLSSKNNTNNENTNNEISSESTIKAEIETLAENLEKKQMSIAEQRRRARTRNSNIGMRTDNSNIGMSTDDSNTGKKLRNGKLLPILLPINKGSKGGDKVIGGYKNATKNRRKYKNTRKYI